MELKGRTVVVLGLGDTGLSMARWLARKGAAVKVADSRASAPHAESLARELPGVPLATGPFSDETIRGADLVAVSPGVDRREPPVAAAIARGVPVVGDVELFAQALRLQATSHEPRATPKVIAVTGTNGKSTVTAMTGEMCRAAGYETVVAGNIGLPVLDALAAVEDGALSPQAYVLELSSFQLESTATLAPDAAALLNLTEDHLDRYDGLSDYAAAKSRVFNGNGVQVLNRDDRRSLDMARAGRPVLTFGRDAPCGDNEWGIVDGGDGRGGPALMHGPRRILGVGELAVAGLHNAANALAAHALCTAVGLPEEPTAAALRSYRGLPHRLQKVGEKDGVSWYDDSKGTNVGATVAALTGMTVPVVLIAGGDGKGQDFAPLAAAVAGRAREVVLIGRDAETIARALAGSGVKLTRAAGMDEAVRLARAAAQPGDAVLLSPACASFDMFRNYAHRGDVFVAAVRARGGPA
jgi:UDP-N-acetylmuramoylalanine--D-glutamate ligase